MVAHMRIVTTLTLLTCLATAWAQDAPAPADQPAAEPAANAPAAQPQKLVVTVVSVEGTVHYMDAAAAKPAWAPLKAGATLGEKCTVRTGLGSGAVLKFADRGQVTINSGTKVGITEFAKAPDGDAVKVRVGLKYGSGRAKVEHPTTALAAGGSATDFGIESPSAGLIAGASDSFFGYASDRGFGSMVSQSKWLTNTRRGKQTTGPGQPGDGKRSNPQAMINQRLATFVGDVLGGQSPTEMNNFAQNGGGRNVFGFNGGSGASLVGGGTPIQPLPCPSSNLATWAGGGTYIEANSLRGSWQGSGAFAYGGNAGYWSGGGTYRVLSGSQSSNFRTALTGTGTYHLAGSNTVHTFTGTGTAVGIGAENPDYRGTGSWVGTGTASGQKTGTVGGSLGKTSTSVRTTR